MQTKSILLVLLALLMAACNLSSEPQRTIEPLSTEADVNAAVPTDLPVPSPALTDINPIPTAASTSIANGTPLGSNCQV